MGIDHRSSRLGVTQDPLTPTLSRQGRGKRVEPYKSRLLRGVYPEQTEIASLRSQ